MATGQLDGRHELGDRRGPTRLLAQVRRPGRQLHERRHRGLPEWLDIGNAGCHIGETR